MYNNYKEQLKQELFFLLYFMNKLYSNIHVCKVKCTFKEDTLVFL